MFQFVPWRESSREQDDFANHAMPRESPAGLKGEIATGRVADEVNRLPRVFVSQLFDQLGQSFAVGQQPLLGHQVGNDEQRADSATPTKQADLLLTSSPSQSVAKKREPPNDEQPPYWLHKHHNPAVRITRCIVASHSAPLGKNAEYPCDHNRNDEHDPSELIHAKPVRGSRSCP